MEKRCTVKFDGHIVHGASALWIAAGGGKYYFKLTCRAFLLRNSKQTSSSLIINDS